MGNSNSRPRLCQVAPSHGQPMEDEPSLLNPTSPWMITAAEDTEEREKRIVGQRKINHLPPLLGKRKVPHIVHLQPGSHSLGDKTGHSIIKSHPPQPAKGWQSVTLAIEPHVNPAKHACMAYKTAEPKDMEWRDGPVPCYSTPSHREHCGTINTRQLQGHMKGLLLAQTMLSHQATKKHQAQQRCFRETRGKPKRMYTSYVEEDEMEKGQRVQLVSRPRQQNIFWDEIEGQILDVRELLQSSPNTDPNVRDMFGS